MFPSRFKELLSVFNSRKIRYLVIGGYAVIVHSQPRHKWSIYSLK
jgi:hypothetical protein